MNGGMVEDIPSNRRGVVDLPLFSDVQPSQYVFPILHTEIGLGNSLLKSFFKWVDYRVEQVSEEEVERRNELASTTRDYDEYISTVVMDCLFL